MSDRWFTEVRHNLNTSHGNWVIGVLFYYVI